MVPLAIFLFIINEIFTNGMKFYNKAGVWNTFFQVVISFILLGLISGIIDWYFYKYKNLSDKKEKYLQIFLIGVMTFGLPIALAEIIVEGHSGRRLITTLVIWTIVGALFGFMQRRYINKMEENNK